MSGTELRRLGGELVSAQDDKITRVVAMLDKLPHRGAADALLVPLRPRLARLRPVRPLTFERLLFTPLDSLILQPADWKRDAPGIPRSALRPLADTVRQNQPQLASQIDARLAGQRADATATVIAVGDLLWPEAAKCLASAPMPANWTVASGLREQDYAALAPVIAAMLGCAISLNVLQQIHLAGLPVPLDRLEPFVSAVARAGPLALTTLLAILTEIIPDQPSLRSLTERLAGTDIDPRLRMAAEQAMDFVVDRLETTAPLPRDLVEAERDVSRLAVLFDDLESRSRERPSRLARLRRARERADAECRAAFGEALSEQVLLPAGGLASADDATVIHLEGAAHSLRRMEQAARRIGGAAHYDRALQACAEQLAPQNGDGRETRMDRARLVEILLGSEAAQSWLATLAG